jgi:hypothetical protein
MALCSELWGEKWVVLKPPLDVPTISYFRKFTTHGHMKEGANEKGASTCNLTFQKSVDIGRVYHMTYTLGE